MSIDEALQKFKDEVLTPLAGMKSADYKMIKNEVAQELGVKVKFLDEAVEKALDKAKGLSKLEAQS